MTFRNSYRGRFAPSPTGPLHFGSLVTAVGSYLDARANGGEWLLRIEDIDAPRTVPAAADDIFRTLEGFGFEWDGEVVFQSRRIDLYHAALIRLQLAGQVYPCSCTRSEIAAATTRRSVDGGLLYPGSCRAGLRGGVAARAWRLRVPDREFVFRDRVQGEMRQNLEREVGDFVLLRADGQYAYQLAVVVDDAAQGINSIVRGADLLESTARQLWLRQCLGLPTPSHAHLPVAVNSAGEKLSKQTRAPAIDPAQGVGFLVRALRFLGQPVPAEAERMALSDFWRWAIAAWRLARVPVTRAIFQDSACERDERSLPRKNRNPQTTETQKHGETQGR
ncbi:MAG: tRNA glutamyl-Q(34) synthetase GluQRS [Candidatus Accumulibacter sp.]|jgi:glutamyl-Q tRNA(Asp) synthetase|nr:tRNA glutamyl-Q(34) synthetase GluQRS [Accumulibacter sp.]